jgi:hypothetical protein
MQSVGCVTDSERVFGVQKVRQIVFKRCEVALHDKRAAVANVREDPQEVTFDRGKQVRICKKGHRAGFC